MIDITKLTLAQAKNALLNKKVGAVELTEAFIKQVEKKRSLNAFITETFDKALEQARESEERLNNKQGRFLEGLPIALKDLFCSKGIRTTAGSKMLKDFIPPYESTVSQNLLNAGAVILGKLNMDEFAMGSTNSNSFFGPVINPWRSKKDPSIDLTPGGSSGGSSAAVAARAVLAATGSDTGGSIRQPAAFTGLVGIKPTYGLCSRWGMIAFASSLDQAGPLARTVEDAALMLEAMAGYDAKDSTSLNVSIPPYSKNIKPSVKGLKIGLPEELVKELSDDVKKVFYENINWLKEGGAEIIPIHLKMIHYALPVYYIIAPAEASSNLARYDGVRYGFRAEGDSINNLYENTRREGFGEEVRRRIFIGTYVLSAGYYDAYYLKAQKVRAMMTKKLNESFQEVDLIVTPTTPTAALHIDEKHSNPVTIYLNDIFTVTANLAGLPAISVPSGLNQDGLPLGLQFIGKKLSEQCLFDASSFIESITQFPKFFV